VRAAGTIVAFVVASLLTDVAIALAVVGGGAGLASAVVVVLKLRNLTEAIDELAGRVMDVESTLGGER
jgi:hypothetical protein